MAHRRSFTLVEMMIVVAIVLVLAAIAIPKLNEMQLKAKRGEVYLNTDGIRDAATGYHAAYDTYIDCPVDPSGTLGKTKQPWVTGTTWDVLGWRPDGDVYANYKLLDDVTMCATTKYIASNVDLDGNGQLNGRMCCVGAETILMYTEGFDGPCVFKFPLATVF